ncbi:TENX protein, partial [Anthoscopus minutus]|nr:TENX protein [Anthoscopus minutus]
QELPLSTEEPQPEKPQTEAPTAEALPVRGVLGELRVSSVTPSSVQLHWSVPQGSFDSFMLQYRDAHGQPQALPIDGGSHSVTVPGLSPSRRYRFHLYGLQGGKRIDRVSIDTVTGEAEASEGPLPSEEPQQKPKTDSTTSDALLVQAVLGEPTVSSVTPSSVQLHWSVPTGSFDSFMLQYRDAHGQPQALPIDGGSRSVTVSGLSPSHRYHFHLYGIHRGKRIDHVSIYGITDKPEESPSPSEEPPTEDNQPEHSQTEVSLVRAVLGELRVSSVTPDSVGLQWSVPEGSFDSFVLQYRDAHGQPQALPIHGGSRSVVVP